MSIVSRIAMTRATRIRLSHSLACKPRFRFRPDQAEVSDLNERLLSGDSESGVNVRLWVVAA